MLEQINNDNRQNLCQKVLSITNNHRKSRSEGQVRVNFEAQSNRFGIVPASPLLESAIQGPLQAVAMFTLVLAQCILDTGASRCVICEDRINELLKGVPIWARQLIRKRNSKVGFRFGNNQVSHSAYQLCIPLLWKSTSSVDNVWLVIEVVKGSAPFLFSKQAIKALGGIIDTNEDTCFSRNCIKQFILTRVLLACICLMLVVCVVI